MKKIILMLAIGIFGVLGVLAQNKVIGMKKAKAIALKQVQGKVHSSKMEKSDGKDVYLIDIRNKKGDVSEVSLDAYSGSVIDTKVINTAIASKPTTKKKHWYSIGKKS